MSDNDKPIAPRQALLEELYRLVWIKGESIYHKRVQELVDTLRNESG